MDKFDNINNGPADFSKDAGIKDNTAPGQNLTMGSYGFSKAELEQGCDSMSMDDVETMGVPQGGLAWTRMGL